MFKKRSHTAHEKSEHDKHAHACANSGTDREADKQDIAGMV
jgi:hypothetical protein